MIAVIPNTRPILAIFEPKTLPKAKSALPSTAATRLTKSSGTEVANDTTVSPTIIFDMLSFKDIETEDLTKNSPPITSKLMPKNNSKMFIFTINKIANIEFTE